MRKLYILGLDIGFANTGIVKAELLPQGINIVNVEVITTEKSNKKREVKVADDNIRRTIELTNQLSAWFDDDVIAVCAESLSLPRNASTASKISLAFGAMTALATVFDVPILQSSPQEVKMAVAGIKSASKDQMIKAIAQRFPKMTWPKKTALREHAADAVAVVVSCLNHSLIISAKKIMQAPENTEIAETPKDSKVLRLLPRA